MGGIWLHLLEVLTLRLQQQGLLQVIFPWT